MEPLLFLAHRLPYPPNKGDKVRSHAFLRHLCARYRVFLGAFIDDPADWPHLEALRRMCAGLHVEPIVPWRKRLESVGALLSGEPASLAYFRSARLKAWTDAVVRDEKVQRAFVFSSPMAQYVLDLPLRACVDFVDLDSAKWGEYALRRPWPASALYRREARRLLDYETSVASRAQTVLFVTDEERRRLAACAPDAAHCLTTIPNGVDSEYFSPARQFGSPFIPGEEAIVFTGAMDYWPNVDGAIWFAREVLPLIREKRPVRFYVVGMNPDRAVRALAGDPAVTVTGRVQDVRPYLSHASVVVAPLRVARGIQNKVLEAMAMAKPVVASAACAGGLSARAGLEFDAAADAPAFAEAVLGAMAPARGRALGANGRAWVLRHYTWRSSFAALDRLLVPAARVPAMEMA